MIEGLDDLLDGSGQPGSRELSRLLKELLGGDEATGRVLDYCNLKPRQPRAYRFYFVIDDEVRSMVAKRLELAAAQRNQLVATRWLPAVGLGEIGPTLLGVAADP